MSPTWPARIGHCSMIRRRVRETGRGKETGDRRRGRGGEGERGRGKRERVVEKRKK